MGAHEVSLRTKTRIEFPALVSQDQIWRDTTWKAHRSRRTKIAPVVRKESGLQVRATTLSFQNMHHYGDLLQNLFKVRRDIFITKKGWDLPEVDEMEFDQYDTPHARWVVIHAYGEIFAGIRIVPTTARCGQHSYMLRDAQLGLLDGMRVDCLHSEAPVSSSIWEASRLFICDNVASEHRLQIQTVLIKTLATTARSVGATHVIGIVPAVFRRWLNRIGMTATAVGPTMEIDGDKLQAALMSMVSLDS